MANASTKTFCRGSISRHGVGEWLPVPVPARSAEGTAAFVARMEAQSQTVALNPENYRPTACALKWASPEYGRRLWQEYFDRCVAANVAPSAGTVTQPKLPDWAPVVPAPVPVPVAPAVVADAPRKAYPILKDSRLWLKTRDLIEASGKCQTCGWPVREVRRSAYDGAFRFVVYECTSSECGIEVPA